ncbi:MAG: hypothetical protein GY765_23970 [bacterium]|nr:hypothetical protein [bacterium]
MNTTNPNADQLFDIRVHRIGRITIMTCILLALSIPIMIWGMFGIAPPLGPLLKGIFTVSSFMIPLSIAEIMAFYPILGTSGLYISYTTGNISNLKLPCAAIGMEAAEVEPSTKEGDIIATMAMAGSVIVCELVLIMGVLLMVPFSKYLADPVLKPAFDNILPALFGPLGAYFILKNYRLAVVPLAIGIVAAYFNAPTALVVPVCVLVSVLSAKYLYKRGKVTA